MEFAATLPLTPRKPAPLGFYLAPLLVEALSRSDDRKGLLLVNQLGYHRNHEHYLWFCRTLDVLGVSLPIQRDDEDEIMAGTRLLVEDLIQSRCVVIGTEEIISCPCGALEGPATILDRVSSFRPRAKAYLRMGHLLCCRVCGGVGASRGEQQVLWWHPRPNASCPTVFPATYADEFREKYAFARAQPRIVSRLRDRAPAFELSIGRFRLDVDFVWALLPVVLAARDQRIVTLVVGHRSLNQAATVTLLGWRFSQPVQEIVVLPYLTMKPSTYANVFDDEAFAVASSHGTMVARCLLGMGLQCRKEAVIGSDLAYWIIHSVRNLADRYPRQMSSWPAAEILQALFAGGMQQLVTANRKPNRRLSAHEARLLHITAHALLPRDRMGAS